MCTSKLTSFSPPHRKQPTLRVQQTAQERASLPGTQCEVSATFVFSVRWDLHKIVAAAEHLEYVALAGLAAGRQGAFL
jgi:hypothetical protein